MNQPSRFSKVIAILAHQAPVAWLAMVTSLATAIYTYHATKAAEETYELSVDQIIRADTLMLRGTLKGSHLSVTPYDPDMQLHVCEFVLPNNLGQSRALEGPSFDYDLSQLTQDVGDSFVSGWNAPYFDMSSVPLIIRTVYTVRGKLLRHTDLYGLHFNYQAKVNKVPIQWSDLVYVCPVDPQSDFQKQIDDGWYDTYAKDPGRAFIPLEMQKPPPDVYEGTFTRSKGDDDDYQVGLKVTKATGHFHVQMIVGNMSPKVLLAHTPEVETEGYIGSDGSLVFGFTDSFGTIGMGKVLFYKGTYLLESKVFVSVGDASKCYRSSVQLVRDEPAQSTKGE